MVRRLGPGQRCRRGARSSSKGTSLIQATSSCFQEHTCRSWASWARQAAGLRKPRRRGLQRQMQEDGLLIGDTRIGARLGGVAVAGARHGEMAGMEMTRAPPAVVGVGLPGAATRRVVAARRGMARRRGMATRRGVATVTGQAPRHGAADGVRTLAVAGMGGPHVSRNRGGGARGGHLNCNRGGGVCVLEVIV